MTALEARVRKIESRQARLMALTETVMAMILADPEDRKMIALQYQVRLEAGILPLDEEEV